MLKLLFPIFIALSVTNAVASAEGIYLASKKVFMVGHFTAEECLGDGAEWLEEHCFFEANDEVRISADLLEISTIGHNAHSCDFSEPYSVLANGDLYSKVEVSDYGHQITTCEVTVKSTDNFATINVSTEGEGCSYFCGMRSVLDIENAVKQ